MSPTASAEPPPLPVWMEIHFDDEVLSAHPERWPQARDLLLRLTALAETRSARLSLRFRESFARLAAQHAPSLLPDLQRRGHEVGAHAHGRRLAETLQALQAAGIHATVAAPGLVQVGPGGRALLLQQAAALGITTVTDHGAARAWAYEGLLPRTEAGLQVLAPTVRPFDWGLMSTDGTRYGLRSPQATRLRSLYQDAHRHGAQGFGFTFHEHDLCPPQSLVPPTEALDTFAQHLLRLGPPAVPASQLCSSPAPPALVPPVSGPSDRQVRMARVVHALAQRLPSRPHRPLRAPPPQGRVVLSAPGGRALIAERLGAPHPRALLVISHAGREGGRRLRFRPFGPVEAPLLQQGWGIWLYDRAGTGDSPLPLRLTGAAAAAALAPGNPLHTTDWQLVLARARAEGVPIVALTWSAGLLPPLRAAAAGHRPDALLDAEGPADRWSLVPPAGNALSALDPWDDALWVGREPLRLLPALQRPYARLQGTWDHVHGEMTEHARRLEIAAQGAGMPVGPVRRLAGRLHAHPDALLAAADWALAAAMRRE